MNNPIALFLLVAFFTTSINSQNTISGKVIDQQTNVYLSNVLIINEVSGDTTYSNNQGKFKLPNYGNYLFQREGYQSKSILVSDLQNIIIGLEILTSELDAVVINVNQIPNSIKASVSSIALISAEEINRNNSINIAPVINRVPGVFMQSGALNTNRITIRGIGARNAFGTAKLRAYFKDIPLTNGSGETNIEDFELETISRIEIYKGSSSTYGAGLGGTIILTPDNPKFNSSNINSRFSIGSFGLSKITTQYNYGTSNHNLNVAYSNTKSDGYRDNNNYNRQTYTLNSNHYFGENDEVSLLGSIVSLKAFIPSSINEDTFSNNPKSAAFTWQQAQGFEDSKRAILGLSWSHDYSNNLKQISSVFGSSKRAYEPRPFNILTEETQAFGLRTRFLGKTDTLGNELEYTFGVEYFKDLYKSATFENLYQDFPEETGSVQGNELSDFKENRQYFNVFLESFYRLNTKLKISLGLNYNNTNYDLTDNFPQSETNPNQSGTYRFNGVWSPKFGAVFQISKNISIFGNISHGFSPITLAETLLPDGQINTDLKPEVGWTYEIGTRGYLLNKKLQYSLVFFRMDVDNLVVSRRIAEDQFIGINAGKTQHDGIELDFNYNILDKGPIHLSSFFNCSLNQFTFKKFINDNSDFSGNDLTGVPSHVYNTGLNIKSTFGLSGTINYQHVGSTPITDSNSVYLDDYGLLNTRLNYKFNLIKDLNIDLFLGLDNIGDTAYASQVLINASGFNGSAPRYYYPGNPINYYLGINFHYSL